MKKESLRISDHFTCVQLLRYTFPSIVMMIFSSAYGVMDGLFVSNFAETLAALTMITSMTILAVTSNVVLSLGMVGALSIVGFRTAIKEPMEIT